MGMGGKASSVGGGVGWRLPLCFGLLAIAPAVVLVRLWSLQVQGGVSLSRPARADGSQPAPLRLGTGTARRQMERERVLPAPRPSLVDRRGRPLAFDRPVVSLHAAVAVPTKYRAHPEKIRAFVAQLAEEWARRLVLDPEIARRSGGVEKLAGVLDERVSRALKLSRLPATGPINPRAFPECRSTSVLVYPIIGSGPALEAVRQMARSEAYRNLLRLEETLDWEREYLEREATWGVVGVLDEWQPGEPRAGRSGLEAWIDGNVEVDAAQASVVAAYNIDVRGARAFWRSGGNELLEPVKVRTTIDLGLQAEATRLLEEAAASGTRVVEGADHSPTWGGLVLVDVPSGDVLAMASWHADAAAVGSLVPYQNTYEPGSIVKPLVAAWALRCGVLGWQEKFDCRPPLRDLGWRHPEWKRRVVHDDHRCGVITPLEILMNSSNIGAVQVGMRLDKAQWAGWMQFYGWATSTGLDLPFEQRGNLPRSQHFDEAKGRLLTEYTIPSLAIGYGINVNVLQVARGYLTMLHGGPRQLRLVQGVRSFGSEVAFEPERPVAEPELNDAVREAVVGAMQAVVSEREGATGRLHLWPMLRDAGVPPGYFAGKSGTAQSQPAVREDGKWKKINVRNASFVAFAPAHAPRYLAVCVLQKERTERFYGGRYAAPAAGRLILRALQEDGVSFSGAGQVSVGSPEYPAGAGGPR